MSKVLGVMLAAILCTGCAAVGDYAPLSRANNVAVADVINQLKCEIKAFYRDDPYHRVDDSFQLPSNKKADVTLKLQIDVSDSAKGSVKLATFATLLGPTFAPAIGGTVSNTIVSEIKFTMRQTLVGQGALDPGVCPADARVLGLKEALVSFYESERKIHSGAPYVGLQTLTFSTAFTLTVTGGATGSGAPVLQFIALGPSLELSATQSGVHALQIVFKGKAAPAKSS